MRDFNSILLLLLSICRMSVWVFLITDNLRVSPFFLTSFECVCTTLLKTSYVLCTVELKVQHWSAVAVDRSLAQKGHRMGGRPGLLAHTPTDEFDEE